MTDPGELEEDAGWGDAVEAEPARVLSQTEIDDLMGFDDVADSSEQQSGLRRVVSAGLISYERLPMLEIVFDRHAYIQVG